MKAYKYLFFDVDDTLLDFRAAEKEALRLLFDDQQLVLTDEDEFRYKSINQALWEDYEKGKIQRDELLSSRFSTFFELYDIEVDGSLIQRKYRSFLEQGHQLISGAYELISNLHNNYDLYIVTNGVSKIQDKRLRDSGLYPFFKQVFVSEDTGYNKPMKEFFEYVFARIPNFSPEQGLIIGDSLSADIKGGLVAGLDTCWFNPDQKENGSEVSPTYMIKNLNELYSTLLTRV